MTTLVGIVAGGVTFLITQLIGAFVVALLATTLQPMRLIFVLEPGKTLTRLTMWSVCGWLGIIVFRSIAV